ncbi:MAG TPA: glycosyltransferase family 1 protein [Gemmatimonadales bacterium]
MRIAYCSESLPPLVDGVTRTLSELVTTLRETRHEFTFLSAVTPDASLPWRDRVHTVPSLPFPLYPYYRICVPTARTLDPVLDRFGPDIVHVVTPSLLGLYGVRYARRRGIPVVASFHTDFVSLFGYYGLGGLERLGRHLARRFYRQCAVTLAPSHCQVAKLRAHGIDNVVLWQRGVNPASFSPAFRSPALRARLGGDDVPILLYVGRLGREKNLRYLVQAMHLLARKGSRFKLVIVGQGPMRRTLAARLPEAVFTGPLEGEELSRCYASADLFVFPSIAETFGNVVLEAFASGLPVIGVDAGSVRELVNPTSNGRLAPADSPAAFADAIHTLLQRPAELARLGLEARITAAQYRWPDVNRQLLEQYERLVAAGGRRAERALAVAV